MTDRLAAWWGAVGTGESFTLKVERAAQPPLPWTWEIVGGSGEAGAQRSARGYRSAEEAWAAGQAVLSGHAAQRPPGALTVEQRAKIAGRAAKRRRDR